MTAWDARTAIGAAIRCLLSTGTTAPRLLAAPAGAPPLTGRRVTLSRRVCSAPGVRRGAQEAQFDDKVARTRREPAPCPRHRLKPVARRVAHVHHVAATTLHDQAPAE
jgi:hypothetical protein